MRFHYEIGTFTNVRNFTQISLIVGFFFFFIIEKSYADHLFGGYFTYTVVSDTVCVELITYTDSHDDESDRDSVEINWGDNQYEFLKRMNNSGDGDVIYDGLKLNVYKGKHLYEKDGVFQLTLSDNFRAEDILNMSRGASGLTTLFITTIFQYGDTNIFCENQGPTPTVVPDFLYAAGDTAKINFGIEDPDGDSLHYALVTTRVKNGQQAPGYRIPINISFDENDGSFVWRGIQNGKWVFTILVTEYRGDNAIGQQFIDFTLEANSTEGPESTGTMSKNALTLFTKDSLDFTFSKPFADSLWVSVPGDSNSTYYDAQIEYSLQTSNDVSGKVIFDNTLAKKHNGLLGSVVRVNWKFGVLSGFRDHPVFMDYGSIEQDLNCELQELEEVEVIIPELETFQIAPSLFDDSFWLNIGDDFGEIAVEIYDLRGRIIARYSDINQSTFKVAISTLRPAVYFVVLIRDNEYILTEKVVKR